MSLIVTTPPTAEPVTLADVKARLRLTDTGDDAIITQHITEAREFCEAICNRSLASKTYTWNFDRLPAPGEALRFPMPPLISVASVTYLDSTLTAQTWLSSEYFIATEQAPGLLIPSPGNVYPWAIRAPGAITVVFTSGDATTFGVNPDTVRRAIINCALFIWENPGKPIPQNLVQIPKVYHF